MQGKSVVLSTVVLVALILVMQPSAVSGVESGVAVPVSTKAVALDGRWTSSGEWQDGAEIEVSGAFFRLKHDDSCIYVLGDYVGDGQLNTNDVAWIYFDTLSNGGTKPQTDDYAFSIQWLSTSGVTLLMQIGTGTDWADASAIHAGASSNDASSDPYSTSPHMIYEFKIPNSIFQPNTASIRARLSLHEGKTNAWLTWPAETGRTNPSEWNQLDFPVPVPEFSWEMLALALSLGASLPLLRSCSRKSPSSRMTR